MAGATIDVDLFNPGQVLACIGLMEAAETLLGGARAGFDWSGGGARFYLSAQSERSPLEVVIAFIAGARVTTLVPWGSKHTTDKWSVPSEALDEGTGYPYPAPDSPATLAVRLDSEVDDGVTPVRPGSIVLDAWGDHQQTTLRDPLKLWGGAGGYPGAGLARDALELVRGVAPDVDPFAFSAPQSSSFRLDWRRDYIPIDAGFSPNKHSAVIMVGYPLVELLAAIGLTYARPVREDKLEYAYGVLGGASSARLHPPTYLRAAFGRGALPFPIRSFRMQLGWTGQEGKERCITIVTEE